MKKNISLLLTFTLFFIQQSFAQLNADAVRNIRINEQARVMSKGNNYSFQIAIPNSDDKALQKKWEAYIKQYKGKTKYDKKAKETFTDNAVIAGINGNNTIDLYTTTSGSTFTVWYDLGGTYLNSREHAEKYKEVERMLLTFAKEMALDVVGKELEQLQDKLDKKDEEFGKLFEKNLEYSLKIEDEKANIEKSKIRNEVANKEKDYLDNVIASMNDYYAEKSQKNFKKQHENTEKKKKDADGDAKKSEDKIKELEKQIDENKSKQNSVQQEIESHKKAVKEVKNRFEEIKKL